MKNYFLKGTCVGLICAGITGLSIMGNSFFDLFRNDGKYYGGVIILIGVLVTIGAAVIADRKKSNPSFISAGLIFPPIIYLSGVIVGCLANWALNGEFSNGYDWFVKPIYWLSLVGLPLSIIIGSFYFAFYKVWVDRGNPTLN